MIRHKAAQKRLSITALATAQQQLEQQQLELKQNQEKEKEKEKENDEGQEGEEEDLPVVPVEVVDKPLRKVLNATGIKYTSLVSNIYITFFVSQFFTSLDCMTFYIIRL